MPLTPKHPPGQALPPKGDEGRKGGEVTRWGGQPTSLTPASPSSCGDCTNSNPNVPFGFYHTPNKAAKTARGSIGASLGPVSMQTSTLRD